MAALVAAIVVVIALVWLVSSGFHNRRIRTGAEALTEPTVEPIKIPPVEKTPLKR